MNKSSNVKKLIGVVSGKGGVGKSSVTSMLASITNRMGYRTAILDADITGPSIPQAFGVHDLAEALNEKDIKPVMSDGGIEIMSVNAIMADATDPVVWRGPILSGVITQFWNDVVWGDIDVMYVDMPPGTADVTLTVFQQLPLDGIVIVTSPQEMVSMIVEKAIKMAKMMNVPIVGIVENMSYFECPDCHKKHRIFGESHVKSIALKYGINEVSCLPINPIVAEACDNGTMDSFFEEKLTGMVNSCFKMENPNKHDGLPPRPEGCTGSCATCSKDCSSRK